MGKIIGIDLDTTNSCVYVMEGKDAKCITKGGVDSLGFVDFSQQFFQIFFPIFHASS